MSSKKAKRWVAVAALASTLVMTGGVAHSSTASIKNGDFETGADGATTIEGWTAVNERIDLGVSTIAGCLTVDTSDYTALRGWEDEFDGDGVVITDDPVANNDSAVPANGLSGYNYDTDEEVPGGVFRTSLKTVEDEDSSFFWESQFVELFSDMDASYYGYVIHGPAIYSDVFYATSLDDLSLDWAATDESDDYKAFGYLLNVDSCNQTEVIDSTGELSEWQTIDVAVPTDGNYRFVFVAGTFDQSFGGAAGAALYVDNVVLKPRQKERLRPSNPLHWT